MNEQHHIGPEQLQSQEGTSAQGFYQPAAQSNAGSSFYEGFDLTDKEPPKAREAQTQAVDWEASEYIHHDKGVMWIIGLVIVAGALISVAVFLQIWTFVLLIIVMAIAMGVFAFRPPRVLHYTLNNEGLRIDDHFYSFADFRAFGIMSEGAFYTIMLIPSKRFMPAVNVFFAEGDGEKIVDILGVRLPMEQIKVDYVDRLMRRLRF